MVARVSPIGAARAHAFAAIPNGGVTAQALHRIRTAIIRIEMRWAGVMTEGRKADTRRKIQLGGLVIKAGLAAEDLAVLLGMLASGAKVLKGSDAADSRRRWKEIGDRLFGSGP
jgi:hypothetical protein